MQESVSVGVGVPGSVQDPICAGEETVHVAGGFGPDGPQPPARGESVKKSVTGMGGVGHNITCMPQSPGAVQVLKRWKDLVFLLCKPFDAKGCQEPMQAITGTISSRRKGSKDI